MKMNTMEKKIKVLEHAFAASAGAYYNINLTRNLVPGVMYQVIEDKEYSLNEQMGLSENAQFTDVVSYWGEKLDRDIQPAYYDFLSISRLLECYKRGERHVFFKYWTKSAIFEPMLAEQHIVMYEDEDNGDILAITYVLDLTKEFNEEKYKKELEEEQIKLESSLREIQREKNILDALSVDYTSVYYCDLLDDTMIALKQEEGSNAAVTETRITDGLQSYSFRIQYYYDTFVIKESAPDFLHKLSAEYLKEYLAHNERLAYRFRTHPNPAGQQYFEVQIVRLSNSSGFKTVMGYRYIDDIIEEQERQKIRLENALAETKFHSQVIGAIGKLYWIIYQMDLVNGTYEEISAGSDIHKLTGKRGNTEEVFKGVRESVVATEHQKIVEEFLDVSTLQERLCHTESISTEYRTENGAWHRARFIVKNRSEDGKVLKVLYVVRQINEEKQAEIKYKEEILEKNRVLSGLSLDYTIAFILNLDTDDYKIMFNQKTNHAKRIKSITKFSDYVDGYTESFVLPELQEEMKRELGSGHIKKRFETEDEYHFSFETVPNAAGLSCFQAHIVKQYDGDEHFAFLGFRSVDEVVKKERFYKEALQKANQALQQQLDMITFALPGGVKISNDDAKYSFKYVSEQFAQMLGYETPEELMKASDGSILGLAHPDDIETGLADALEQYTKSDHYTTTYRVKCKDGSWKYIEDRGHKVISEDGNIEHWNLILDKNELMEKTIALEIEKKANQNKSDFLSRMSHDMRTPLNGIIGLLDICERHSDDKKLVDSSRMKAKVAAGHLLSLVNDSLELNKLESENAILHEEVFYIPALMQEVNTIAQMQADEGKINISYNEDVDSLKYPYLIGNPLYIKQILLNLITNGIKYNKDNGSVEYDLSEKQISETQVLLEFTVKDTGIGMKPEFLKDIFKPFVQEDTGARSTYMGTGLGMAIVKNLIDCMKGTIKVDSTEGVGTTINVAIPFKIADASKNIEGKISENLSSVNYRRNLRVLLAEDNELNREIAAFVLRDEGIEVIEVLNGQQAVDAFLENTEYYFDVVLMDIMMPVMDGYQATNAIRNSGRKDAKTIPIVAMTANAFDDAQEKSKAAGMNMHLLKPLDARKLIRMIEYLCYKE